MATNGNGSNGVLRHADAVLVDAILGLTEGLKVEIIKMEGLANTIAHHRIVTTKQFRREYLNSVKAVGERHLAMVARVEAELGEKAG